MLRSLNIPAMAALETFFRSMREMPYMAPSAGIKRQSTRWRIFAAFSLSKDCSEDVEAFSSSERSCFSATAGFSLFSTAMMRTGLWFLERRNSGYKLGSEKLGWTGCFYRCDPRLPVNHRSGTGQGEFKILDLEISCGVFMPEFRDASRHGTAPIETCSDCAYSCRQHVPLPRLVQVTSSSSIDSALHDLLGLDSIIQQFGTWSMG